MKRDGALESLWQQSGKELESGGGKFNTNEVYDALIIGGGITGISTALELQKAGKKVLLAEAQNIGFGTSGGTTAHLNNFFDSSYDKVIKNFGEDNAKLLATAGKETIGHIRKNIKQYDIKCNFEEKRAYIFSLDEKQSDALDKIIDGTRKAGIQIDPVNDSPFPIPYLKIAVIEEQAQFNPIEYLYAMAGEFIKLGGIILEQCRVTGLNEDEILTAETSAGIIKSRHAVYATHIPPGVNILHFRCAPYRSYAMALKLKDNKYPDVLGYDLCDPYHYYRSQKIGNEEYLIAGGEDHKTAHEENTDHCFDKLEAYLRQYFDIGEIAFKWSSQYFEPVDGLPYIGHLPGNRKNVYTATGFSGNGMIFGSLSALILTDLILDRPNKYSALFNPGRVKPLAGFSNFVNEAADVVGHLITDPFSAEKITSYADIAAGEAKIVKYEGQTLAMYKDGQHNLHIVNSACTHIKCTVAWNGAEKSWDCPCHGSRFSYDGKLLTGPARKDLQIIRFKDLKV